MTIRWKIFLACLSAAATIALVVLLDFGGRWLAAAVALLAGVGLACYLSRLIGGSLRDVDERLRTEQRLRDSEGRLSSILQSLGAGVIATDQQGRVAFLNPVAERLTGWDLVDALNQPVGEVLDLVDETTAHPLEIPLVRVLEEGEIVDWGNHILLRSRIGASRPVACTVAPIVSFVGMIGAVFVFRDTSKEREAQHNLLVAKEEAERASRAKSEFLAGMSHEIRTPLTAILGMADLLEQTGLKPDQRRYVKISRAAGENLLDLINGILDLSKIEAGKLEVEVVEFDLDRLVRQLCEIMVLRASQKGLEFVCRSRWPSPCPVLGDPTRIRQVLVNLIGNAIKFTEEGRVIVETAYLPEDGPSAPDGPKRSLFRFVVKDTGIGIPQEKQELVFDDFAQANSSITRCYGGTGLGLAISRKLVHLMGGRIGLDSREGVGSVFTVELPLPFQEAVGLGDREPLPAAEPALSNGAEPGRMDILLAEDSPDNCLLFSAYLQGTGHRLDLAANGYEAVEKMMQGRYDLVLMDIQMPEMDGYSATRAIRAWEERLGRPRTPILALTAHAFQEDVRKSREAGCDSHLVKPIKLDDFLRAVNRYLPAKGGKKSAAAPETFEVEAFVADLVPGYLRKVADDLGGIEAALGQDDWEQVRLLAHNLKGSGGGYGFERLSSLAAELEEASGKPDREAAASVLAEMRLYLDRVSPRHVIKSAAS
ncbi:MAG TPA: response regulator [Desulfurivibrio alkaliphilus]|uniref:Sensory/regulatory protein RpfC n=1 Tax=Desulfurivibrio alkaliphilus TaxID=427923 RepID=A0A7C2XG54_9BACT|nr:response regulator [Desulfurivibrio alkaliphilus]